MSHEYWYYDDDDGYDHGYGVVMVMANPDAWGKPWYCGDHVDELMM